MTVFVIEERSCDDGCKRLVEVFATRSAAEKWAMDNYPWLATKKFDLSGLVREVEVKE